MLNRVGTYFLGSLLLMVGVLLLIHVMGWVGDTMAFLQQWWTLFLIIPCTIRFFFDGDKFLSLVGIIAGVVLFLASRGILIEDYKMAFQLVIPIVIIFVAIRMLANGKKKDGGKHHHK